jgi:hypothetical protein
MVRVERGEFFETSIVRLPFSVGAFSPRVVAMRAILVVCKLSTDVSEEMCPTVQHPLGMVGARLWSFRSARFRNGPGGCSSRVWEGVCDVDE